MRNLIIKKIFEVMSVNKDVFFLTADMGINLVEPIQDKFPDRFLNVGIAEQNLIGVSAGLANLGYRPFAYTISNFLIHRCFEQIRNDISLHDYPITLIGTSTGFDNAPLGPTHHITDDWGVMKGFSNFQVFCPSSMMFAESLISRVLEESRPTYIRVPKGNPLEPDSVADLVFFGSADARIVLITYGTLAQECLKVQKLNPDISVIIINRLYPLDEQLLLEKLKLHEVVISVEDHFPTTGLYSSICEVVVRNRLNIEVLATGPTCAAFEVGGTADYYHQMFGLDSGSLIKQLEKINGN